MGLASNFNNAIHKELTAYAAWWPIVNAFKVGDFGVFKDGVFQSLGNIKDKYPDIDLKLESGGPAQIDFKSEGTRTLKFDASGNPVESFAGLGNAKASLKLVFESENSSMIKANMTVSQLANIDQVGTALANKNGWRNKFCVVSAVYTGDDSVVICSREAGTEVTIGAEAEILQQVEAGKVVGNFEYKSNKDSTFKAIGESGALALRLFKLNIFNKTKVLAAAGLVKDKDFKIEKVSDKDVSDDTLFE